MRTIMKFGAIVTVGGSVLIMVVFVVGLLIGGHTHDPNSIDDCRYDYQRCQTDDEKKIVMEHYWPAIQRALKDKDFNDFLNTRHQP